jgi:hypothetical protein
MVPISVPRIGRLGWKSDLRWPRAQGRLRAHLTNSLGSTRGSHSAPSKTDVALSGPPRPTDRRADKLETRMSGELAMFVAITQCREQGKGFLGKVAGTRAQGDALTTRPGCASSPARQSRGTKSIAPSGRTGPRPSRATNSKANRLLHSPASRGSGGRAKTEIRASSVGSAPPRSWRVNGVPVQRSSMVITLKAILSRR